MGNLPARKTPNTKRRWWLWIVVAVCSLAIGGSAAFIAEPDTWRWYSVPPTAATN